MPERDTFLRTICEHPHDDAPRLVYADWLNEQGDHDRAEFIRLQIAIAKRPPTNLDPLIPDVLSQDFDCWEISRESSLQYLVSPYGVHRDYFKLRDRINVLRARHEQSWRSELPDLPFLKWGEFHRGFVEEAIVNSVAAFLDNDETVRYASPVRFLRLGSFRPRGESYGMDASDIQVEARDWRRFGSTDWPSRITSYDLMTSYRGLGDQLANWHDLVRPTELEHLRLLCNEDTGRSLQPGNPIFEKATSIKALADDGGRALANWITPTSTAKNAHLSRFSELIIWNREIDPPLVEAFQMSPFLRSLKHFNLGARNVPTRDTLIDMLGDRDDIRLWGLRIACNTFSEYPSQDDSLPGWLLSSPVCSQLTMFESSVLFSPRWLMATLAKAPWLSQLVYLGAWYLDAKENDIDAFIDAMADNNIERMIFHFGKASPGAMEKLKRAFGEKLSVSATLDWEPD